jgi:hypothetical protein
MRHLFLALAIAASVAACGNDDATGTTDADPRAGELATVLSADPDLAFTEDEARCTANGIVETLDDVSVDTLLDGVGLDLDTLADPDDSIAAFDAYLDCVDIEQKMVDSLAADDTPEPIARCIAQSFDEDELRTILGASALPGAAVDEEAAFALLGQVFESAQTCFEG